MEALRLSQSLRQQRFKQMALSKAGKWSQFIRSSCKCYVGESKQHHKNSSLIYERTIQTYYERRKKKWVGVGGRERDKEPT